MIEDHRRRELTIIHNEFEYHIYVRNNIVGMHIYVNNLNADFVAFIEGFKNIMNRIRPFATHEELTIVEKFMFELQI